MNEQIITKFEVVDNPNGVAKARGWGKFQHVIEEVRNLAEGKCLKVERLSIKDVSTLRSAGKVAGVALSIRTTPEASYVWVKQTIESVNEARDRKASQ